MPAFVQDWAVTDQFRVVVSAGLFKPADGRGLEVPHRWTTGGVSVDTDFTGAHLLHLAAAGCVLNDVYREAANMDVQLDGVRVAASGDYDPETWRSTGIDYAVELASPATPDELTNLLRIVDAVAEIPRAIRFGAPVRRVPVPD
jgi:uncharacterized OsmC-like protein